MRDLAYLKLLSREYPNIRAAASDIINLQAICGLPKGTEYFSVTCTVSMRRLFICSAVRRVLSGRRSARHLDILFRRRTRCGWRTLFIIRKNDQSDQTGERIHGGLAEDGGVPSGADLPGGFVEIHPFQGEKKDAEEFSGVIDELYMSIIPMTIRRSITANSSIP